MADYDRREHDRQEFERLQSEAASRAREMQHRSRLPVPNNTPPMPEFVQTPYRSSGDRRHIDKEPERKLEAKREEKEPVKTQKSPPSKGGFNILKMLNFKNMDIDNDRALVLLLIALLASEGCDEIMLLALFYIIL